MSSSGSSLLLAVLATIAGLVALTGVAPADEPSEELAELSLEDLMNVTVTSASKREERRTGVAAAITVLSNEDIRRSGMTSIPEVLRLVPGLDVAQLTSNTWAITARGYNNRFANKLLVLIDGRSVYTPLFGGTYWDIQDVMLEDVDRIEVIRGPGGALWGTNAVNGVINIITKNAHDTQGLKASGIYGNREAIGAGRYGVEIGEDTAVRVWSRGFDRDDFDDPGPGLNADDDWTLYHVGMRVDSTPTDSDTFMLDGAYYGGQGGESSFNTAPPPLTISDNPDYHGGHVLGRWSHAWSEDSTTHVQAYWDYKWRRYTVRERRNSFDIEVLHDWTLTRNVFLNVGTNYRYTDDDTAVQSPGIAIVPSDENLHLANAFGQLQVNLLDDKASVIVGAKLGWNDITNFEWQPTVRGIVKPWEGNAFWASVSRAERTPARSDRQLVFGPLSLGNDDLDAEVLWAFEAGYRNFMREDLTVDLSMFYNDYDDLITTQTVGPRFENDLDSESWGGEVEINWQPRDWVRFIFGYSLLLINEDYAVGALPVFGSNKKSNPRNSVVGRVQFNLPWNFELDTFVSWIDDIHAQSDANGHSIDDYWRVDLRLGWKPFDWLRLDAVGQNLNDDAHPEFGDLVGLTTYVPRTYYGKITVSY